MPVVYLRAALRELAHEVAWYERRIEGLGAELAAEIEAKLRRIEASPSLFRPTAENARVRRALLRRFPFWILFCETDRRSWSSRSRT